MPHSLDGARLKIIRAQEHIDALKAEIGMYLNEQPNEIRSQPAPYDHRGGFQVYLGRTLHVLPQLVPAPPPIRLSTIIGDCVTNTRAALDYIMWELAQRYFVPVVNLADGNDRKLTAFPLYERPDTGAFQTRFNTLANRQIPADALAEIKGVQPYNTGYESLWWLHELVNRDKHRMPLLTLGHWDEMIVTLATPPIYADLSTAEPTLRIRREMAAEETTLKSDVQMKGEVALYVTWKDVPMPREPVERSLEQIVKTAADVIPRFDRFF